MIVVKTERLVVRQLVPADAQFILRLLNEPAFLENIGDRGVHDLDQALGYIQGKAAEIESTGGRGMYLFELKDGAIPIGICGLLKRDSLPEVDLGYALLAEHGGKGYALEAARATMAHGRDALGLGRLLAIVSPGNQRSTRLLEKLGFVSEGLIRIDPDESEVLLFAAQAGPA